MLNQFEFIGNLTKKPELRKVQTKNGDEVFVTTLTIAVDRRRSGLPMDGTDFFDVTAWGKTAENCFNYLGKGSRVLAKGYIAINSFERDGQRRFFTQFTAQRVVFLSRQSDMNVVNNVSSQGTPFSNNSNNQTVFNNQNNNAQGNQKTNESQSLGFNNGPPLNNLDPFEAMEEEIPF